jgi:hypothetical protein
MLDSFDYAAYNAAVWLEILKVMISNITIFCKIIPPSPLKDNVSVEYIASIFSIYE